MIFVLIYTLFTVLLAFFNSYLIKKDKRIFHGLNGGLHLGVAVVIGVFCGWWLGAATLFFVRSVFDSALNLFRKLPLGYISPDPESIIDDAEIKVVLFITSKLAKGVIVTDYVHKVVICLRISYLVVGSLFSLVQ